MIINHKGTNYKQIVKTCSKCTPFLSNILRRSKEKRRRNEKAKRKNIS